jgi:hypothetical protein
VTDIEFIRLVESIASRVHAASGLGFVAAGKLLPLVYDELRKLAAATLAQEKPGQMLQI